MRPSLVRLAALVALAAVSLTSAAPATADVVPACDASKIALRLDPVSSDGGVLAIRNVGSTACEIVRVPRLELRDAAGTVISTGRPRAIRFMHPGPVLVPLVLEPGQVAATTLRWPTGPGHPRRLGTGGGEATVLAVFPGSSVVALAVRVTVPTDDDAIVFGETWLTTKLASLGEPSPPTVGEFVAEGPGGSVARVGDALRDLLHMNASRPDHLTFTLDATAGDDRAPNVGSLSGTFLVAGTHATFADPSRDCALALDGYGDRVVVKQTGTCGFGYAVRADGQYRRRTDAGPRSR